MKVPTLWLVVMAVVVVVVFCGRVWGTEVNNEEYKRHNPNNLPEKNNEDLEDAKYGDSIESKRVTRKRVGIEDYNVKKDDYRSESERLARKEEGEEDKHGDSERLAKKEGDHNVDKHGDRERLARERVCEEENNTDKRRGRIENERLGREEEKYTDTKPGGRILILHPIYCGSHERVLRRLGEVLVKRGHQVTQIRFPSSLSGEVKSTVKVMTLRPNNSDLRYPYMDRDGTFMPPTTMLWDRPRRQWQLPLDVFQIIDAHCQTLLGDPGLRNQLRRTNYTLAIVDLIGNECSLALAHSLGIPVVGFWGFSLQGSEPRAMGMFQSPAIVPAFMSELGVSMTFVERLWNSLITLVEHLIVTYHFTVTDDNIKNLAPHVPDSRTLLDQVNVVLVNSHFLLDYPKLLPPHIQYVGCIMCGTPSPLPPHIQAWVNGAEAGLAVFSLGYTGYEASTVPTGIVQAFLAAFARVKQRVLLRFHPALLTDVPPNVMVLDWLPQHDALGDPKTVVFVSHCGQGGVSEAVYHGVPLVCVPIFADQGDNARRVADRGLGVVVDKSEVTESTAYIAITTIINNHKYRETVRRMSRLWQEEASTGEDLAVGWVERVHYHGPLTHLKMPGANLSLIQYFAIDAHLCLVFILLVLPCSLVYVCCRKSSSAVRRRQSTKDKLH